MLLLVSYGLNTGVYYSISTLLSQLIKPAYSNLNQTELDRYIGLMGVVMSIVGVLGTCSGGLVLDKFKKFKVRCTFNHSRKMHTAGRLQFLMSSNYMTHKSISLSYVQLSL